LFACPQLRDEHGRTFDGNGDNIPGEAFQLDFDVLITNILLNPNLDLSLAGWAVVDPTPISMEHGTGDADGSPTSGSVSVSTSTGASHQYAFGQCVAVNSGRPHLLSGRVRISSSTTGSPSALAAVDFFGFADCEGSPVGSRSTSVLSGTTGGAWGTCILSNASASEGAVSALVTFVTQGGSASLFTAELDNLTFAELEGLFGDGFESGDSSTWSAVAP
jgi:hypothetical protein